MEQGEEKVIINNIDCLSGVKMLLGYNISNFFSSHVHNNYYIFGMISKGKREITINDNCMTLKKGDVFIINPCEAHSCNIEKNHDYIIFLIDQKNFRKIYSDNKNPRFTNFIIGNKVTSDVFLSLYEKINKKISGMEIECIYYSFLDFFLTNYFNENINSNSRKVHYAVKKIKFILEENLEKKISLKKLSELVDISPFHLNRIFNSEVGVSLHSYLINLKIEKSKNDILNGEKIVNIALKYGFVDQSHYTRMFKRIIGVTPGNFDKNNNYI